MAPSAHEFFIARGSAALGMEYADYMNFAELYADFLVEFEKKGGRLHLCTLWPAGRTGRMVDF